MMSHILNVGFSLFSRLSNKTDKNLNDFEDENSNDEDMLQLAHSLQQQHQLAGAAPAASITDSTFVNISLDDVERVARILQNVFA